MKGKISSLAALSALCLLAIGLNSCEQKKPYPEILSHRGSYMCEPKVDENTIEALRGAQELGCYACEFDVHKTLDGELIIHHNNKINDTLDCQKSNWTDIQKVTLPYGGKIPTLRQWLEQAVSAAPQMKLALEIKKHPTPEKEAEVIADILALCKEFGVMDRTYFLSFSLFACQEVLRQEPSAKVVLNSSDLWEKVEPEMAKEYGFTGISYNVSVFMNHPEWIERAKQLGLQTYLWMVDHEEALEWGREHGVDVVTTDFPDRMLRYTGR